MKHENTRIHQKALELIDVTEEAIARFPSGTSDVTNQLRRAASSVGQNFAEGSSKSTPKDRANFFSTAKGSAAEVSMILDIVHRRRLIDDALLARGKDICDHLGGMLYKYR